MAKLKISRFVGLADAQAFYLAKVDEAANRYRSELMPPNMVPIYDKKLQEAQNPDKPTPWLDAESASTGKPREEVIQSVLKARAVWEELSSKFEAKRAWAKDRIRRSKDPEQMRLIYLEMEDLAAG